MSSLPTYAASHPDFLHPSSSSSPLGARYSDLAPQRSSNPTSFRSAVAWWSELLAQANWTDAKRSGAGDEDDDTKAQAGLDEKGKQRQQRSTDAIVLRVDEAMLERWTLQDFGRPLGIGTAIIELSRTSAFVPLRHFLSTPHALSGPLSSSPSLSQRLSRLTLGGVTKALLGTPIVWAASQVGILGGSENDGTLEGERDWRMACKERDWVMWSNLERISTALLEAHFASPKLSPLDSLFSRETFRRDLLLPLVRSGSVPNLSEVDLKVVLRHLARDRGVARVEGEVIKLARSEEEKVGEIREEERGIVAIRTTHARLESQVREIEKRIEDCNAKVSISLRSKQKNVALSYLKSRKALEELLDRRAGALSTLHSTLLKIEQAAGDAEVLSAYERSASTLRTLLSDPRLKVQRVEGTMESLSDALADQKEIEEAVLEGQKDVVRAAGKEWEMEEDEERELERELERLRIEVEGEGKKKEEEDKAQRQREREEREKKEKLKNLEKEVEERMKSKHDVQQQQQQPAKPQRTETEERREFIPAE